MSFLFLHLVRVSNLGDVFFYVRYPINDVTDSFYERHFHCGSFSIGNYHQSLCALVWGTLGQRGCGLLSVGVNANNNYCVQPDFINALGKQV